MAPSPLQSIVLGVVQGLTEFLPISSSGHLILVPILLGWQDPGLAFDVALHLGTLAGVVVYFWRDLLNLLIKPEERKTLLTLFIATLPAGIAGLLFEHHIETYFRSITLVAVALIVMGTLLGLADRFCRGEKNVMDLTLLQGLLIGFAQALALIPGVSRSGVTISCALLLGLSRREAARFSFFMSVPVIAGAGILKFKAILASPDLVSVSYGFVASAIAGFAAIWGLMKYVQTRSYTPFVIYRWALGLFLLFYAT